MAADSSTSDPQAMPLFIICNPPPLIPLNLVPVQSERSLLPKASTSEGQHNDKPRSVKTAKRRPVNYNHRVGQKLTRYTVDDKAKVIDLLDKGVTLKDIVELTGIPESTVRGFKKRKKEIKERVNTAKEIFTGNEADTRRLMFTTYARNHLLAAMEVFLHKWIQRRTEKQKWTNSTKIKHQARLLYDALAKKKNVAQPKPFQASDSWFKNFKDRFNLQRADEEKGRMEPTTESEDEDIPADIQGPASHSPSPSVLDRVSNHSENPAQCDKEEEEEEEEEEVCILEAPTKNVGDVMKEDVCIVEESVEDEPAARDEADDPLSLCDVTGVKVEEDICIVEEPIDDVDPDTTTTTKPCTGAIKSGRYKSKGRAVNAHKKQTERVLTLELMIEMLSRLDTGWSTEQVMEQYQLPKSSLDNIINSRDKIMTYVQELSATTKNGKKSKKRGDSKCQSRDCCEDVRDSSDEVELDPEMFRKHGLVGACDEPNTRVKGEADDTSEDAARRFRWKFKTLLQKHKILLEHVYSASETGLYYRSIPRNMSVGGEMVGDSKLCTARVSVLCCANATGSHRLKPLVVGKVKQPRWLQGMTNHLPATYTYSSNAQVTAGMFSHWFFNQAVPEIIHYQTNIKKLSRDKVKALLLLSGGPAHPRESELVGDFGRIRVMFLPPGMSSVQPMDQGVTSSLKRLYRRRFLENVMVEMHDEGRDIGRLTLDSLKEYSLRSAIYDVSRSWQELKQATLITGWNRLLHGIDPILDLQGIEAADFHHQFVKAGERISVEDVQNWLKCDEGEPGAQTNTDEVVAVAQWPCDRGDPDVQVYTKEVIAAAPLPDRDLYDSDEDDRVPVRPKLSAARVGAEVLLDYLEHPDSLPKLQSYAPMLRVIRDALIRTQSQWPC